MVIEGQVGNRSKAVNRTDLIFSLMRRRRPAQLITSSPTIRYSKFQKQYNIGGKILTCTQRAGILVTF